MVKPYEPYRDPAVPTDSTWIIGQKPWLRREATASRKITCPFCGDQRTVLSNKDDNADYGRIELYCASPFCDAREIVILMTRGEGVHRRADVRALNATDSQAPEVEPPPLRTEDEEYERQIALEDMTDEEREAEEIYELRKIPAMHGGETTRRRVSTSPFQLRVD